MAKLTPEESKLVQEGKELQAILETPGFQIIESWLKDMAFHSWVDPRTIEGPDSKKQWEWQELNAFYAANQSKELLERISSAINQAEYLIKKEKDEVGAKPFKL